MDTQLLRSFIAVVRSGSFTEAARDLGYTQSTVTGHLQKLERQLGHRLLDRFPAGAVPTDFGARLAAHADEVLIAEDRLRAAAHSGGARPSGTVRVRAPESLCTYRLPAAIRDIRTREPDVQVWLTPGGLDDALTAVRRGTAELALTMEPRGPLTELTAEPLGSERLVLIDHAARHGSHTTWEELAARDALLIEEGCGYSDDIAARLVATGARPGRRSRFGSIEAIKRCVAVGLGWAVLPAISVESEIRAGELAVLDGPDLPPCVIHLITHPRRHAGEASTVVCEELRRHWKS